MKNSIAASIAGIVVNLLLAGAKIAAGLLSGLVSVLADGINNLTDSGSCIVSLIFLRIAQKPADREHPYGHQRAEYIASLIIAFLVLLLAAELLMQSAESIGGERREGGVLVYVLLGVSIAVKAGMYVYYSVVAKRSGAHPLRATATDSLCDCLSSFVVLAGMLLSQLFSLPLDGWAGILVAIFIAWQGIGILRDASSKLIGTAPDPALTEGIRDCILAGEGVLGLHDLHLYSYGSNKQFATAHVEMDASEPVMLLHAALDHVEREVQKRFGVELTAHLDPVDLNDEEMLSLRERVCAAVEGMQAGLSVHDFRLVRGEKVKAVFEVSVPFSCPKKDGEIEEEIAGIVRTLGDYQPVVHAERA